MLLTGGYIVDNQILEWFSLTTPMSRSPHMSLRVRSGHERRDWRHTDPRCVQRLEVPVTGTSHPVFWRTAHQKCTLWIEQTHQEVNLSDREGGVSLYFSCAKIKDVINLSWVSHSNKANRKETTPKMCTVYELHLNDGGLFCCMSLWDIIDT